MYNRQLTEWKGYVGNYLEFFFGENSRRDLSQYIW